MPFCTSDLFNPLTRNSSFAETLTPCLVHVFLPWAQTLFTLGCFLFLLFYGAVTSAPRLALTKVLLVKFILAFVVYFAAGIRIVLLFKGDKNGAVHPEAEFGSIVSCLSSFFMFLSEVWRWRRGILSSMFLHLCWFVKILVVLVEMAFINREDQPSFDVACLIGIEVIGCVFATLLHLLVDRYPHTFDNFDSGNKETCPDRSASSFSRAFFCYASYILRTGYKTKLDYSHNWALDSRNHPETVVSKFLSNMPPAESRDSEKPWIPWMFVSLMKSEWFLTLAGVSLAWLVANFMVLSPLFLKLLVDSVEFGYPLWFSFGVTGGMALLSIATFVTATRCDFYALTAFLDIDNIISNVIYAKTMRLSPASRVKYSAGEVVNLVSTDKERIRDFWFMLQDYVYSPTMIVYCMIGLELVIGHNAFYGLIAIILFLPFNGAVMKKLTTLETAQMELKDDRLKLMTDVLSGIKVVKLYAWEEPMRARVGVIRSAEVRKYRAAQIGYSILEGTFSMCPIVATVTSFAGFILIDGKELTPQIAFISLMLFNLMRFSVYRISGLLRDAINVRISLLRVQKFLAEPEIVECANVASVEDEAVVVEMKNASFSWNEVKLGAPVLPQLDGISFEIKQGELVGIIGRVGAGKSSLLNSIINEMNRTEGTFYRRKPMSVAYVPQEAWIQNMTLKDNILFGKAFDEERYRTTVDTCALRDDLKMLPAHDQTEIGERGLNLSGGQKARVSLARAVYQDADLYLLDDTLSAVDSHVGAHIFEHVIGRNSVLKDKTRLFALNSISFLSKCDRIIVMTSGKIEDIGTFEELSAKKSQIFVEILKELAVKQEQEDEHHQDTEVVEEMDDILNDLVGSPRPEAAIRWRMRNTSSCSEELAPLVARQTSNSSTHSHPVLLRSNSNMPTTVAARLVDEEDVGSDNVGFGLYWSYIKAFGPGLAALYAVSMFVVRTSFESISQIYLSKWSTAMSTHTATVRPMTGLAIYAAFSISSAVFVALASVLVAVGAYRASRKLHDSFLRSLMRSPMSFFDTTPMGRILNRLSNDIQRIDNDIPGKISFTFVLAADVIMSIASSVYVLPYLGIITVFAIVVIVVIVRFYTKTSVQIRRLCSKSRSKITSHLQDTYSGSACIRAFDVTDRFKQEMIAVTMTSSECSQFEITCNRWIQLRMDLFTITFSSCFTLCAAYMGHYGQMTTGSAALLASTGTMLRGLLGEIARQIKDVEQATVAVERVQEYIDNSHEAEWTSPLPPGADWPSRGVIRFEDYSLRYRPSTPLVLKQLNLRVEAGQKVGIVGRTGAGKTSLTMALFRIIEPASGTIFIDDVDFRSVGLHELRKAVTIIPQDPVLFSGTLRENLDPFEEIDDAAIWEAVEKAHLSRFAHAFPEKLQHPIGEGGSNLSVGQRQLVCLARALLRKKTRILVLDEATAAVDVETDQLIQQSIRSEFAHCTILTIAHRLNTIMDYDKVLVMDAGQIREFDAPKKLLDDKQSLFYGLAAQAKLV